MRNIYEKNTANYPRLKTDAFFCDYDIKSQYDGIIDDAIRFVENFNLTDDTLWERLAHQFYQDSDYDAGWRGEFWGKQMRGACFVYSYTRNEKLYNALLKTVQDMMNAQDEQGRISSYAQNHEFDGWDIWSRKYVLLGMQYFLEICTDAEFSKKVTECMCRQVDYIMSKIGRAEDGKKPITKATRHWRGLNSSSLLEPVVRLYSLTGEKKYLDFAAYIVECGGTEVENIFDLAYENKFSPYQYPITKAYEMISCFEGLLEYYRITGVEKYRKSIINFANRILEDDFTIIGCCGCTHELFDHSTVRQANTTNGKTMQETCVTVTLMKFFYQLTLLTGDSKYVDAFETSMYNAYLGSINTENVKSYFIAETYPDWINEPLPFDSYSPLTAGKRDNGVGGHQYMSDGHFYGCCACIGAAGAGLIHKVALMATEKGFAYNLFINGAITAYTPTGKEITFRTETKYPVDGIVKITLEMPCDETFEVLFRNPYWSGKTKVYVNGAEHETKDGYVAISKNWKNGDVIEIELDMRTVAIRPIPYGSQIITNKVIWGINYMVPTFDEEDPLAKKHIALRRGPIVMAQENRLGYSVDDPVDIQVDGDGYVDVKIPEKDIAPYKHIIELQVPLKNGKFMTVTDYASAGKLWTDESKMAAWMLTE